MQVVPLSSDEIGLLAAASDGQGTVKQNQWARNRYRIWANSHNQAVPSDNISPEFDKIPSLRLTFVITKLITEIRDSKGELYLAPKFYCLILALNRGSVLNHHTLLRHKLF